MKKYLCWLVVCGMVFLMAPQVVLGAAGYWEGEPGQFWEIDTQEHTSGGGSLKIFNIPQAGLQNPRFVLSPTEKAAVFEADSTYRLTFDYKLNANLNQFVMLLGDDWTENGIYSFPSSTTEWQQFDETFTASPAFLQGDFLFTPWAGAIDTSAAGPVWLDNFRFYKVEGETQTEIFPMANPDFEDGLSDVTPPEEVTNLSVVPLNGALQLRFTKSAATDLSHYVVYDADTGARLTNLDYDGSLEVISVSGLTNGTTYNLRLAAVDTSDNESAGVSVSGTPRDNGAAAPSNWTFNSAVGFLDYENKKEGKASLYFSGQHPTDPYFFIRNDGIDSTGLAVGDKIAFRFWAKFRNVSNAYLFYQEWADPYYRIYEAEGTDFDWTEIDTGPMVVTEQLLGGSLGGFNLIVPGVCAEGWLDDIRMYKVEENGDYTPLGDPFVINGNFEANVDTTPPADVSNLTVTAQAAQLTLSWEEPADVDFAKVAIYSSDNLDTPVKEVDCGTTEAVIDGLTNGQTYTFVVKAVDAAGNESAGVTQSGTPVEAPYEVGTFVAQPSNILTAAQSGPVSGQVSIAVTNNTAGPNFTAQLICGLYRDDVLLKVFSSGQQTIAQNGEPVTLTATVSLDQLTGSGYRLKFYVWDGLLSMRPLCASEEMTQ